LYSADHDEMIPVAPRWRLGQWTYDEPTPTPNIYSVRDGRPEFLGVAHPYVRNLDVFFCPTANEQHSADGPRGKPNWGRHDPNATGPQAVVESSYAWRERFAGASVLLSDNGGRAMLLDANVFALHIVGNSVYCHGYHEDKQAGPGIFSADFVNVLYGDGHVKGYNTPHNELSGPLFHKNEPYYGPGATFGTEGMFGRIFLTADRMGGGGD